MFIVRSRTLKPILSIGLALLLPVLGNLGYGLTIDNPRFVQKWVVSSLYVLSLWYGLLTKRYWKRNLKTGNGIAFFVILACFLGAVFYFYNHETYDSFNFTTGIRLVFTGLIVYFVQGALYTQDMMTDLLVEKEQLQTENVKIQLKQLRNQMDPHFFFNSLNTLRSMVRQNHRNSEQFIIGLSDFYRQLLKHQENTTLTLLEELSVLKSYLFLMKNRNEKALHTNLKGIDKAYNHYNIPTLALQSVVENCFKHNVMSSKMPLEIKIRTTDNGYIEVINQVQPKLSPQETSGVGLDLLKRRYGLMKIDDGVLVNSNERIFSVQLKLIPSE